METEAGVEPGAPAEDDDRREVAEESEEAIPPISRPRPRPVSEQTRREHEDYNHAIYCSWCKVCVEGCGLGNQHRS